MSSTTCAPTARRGLRWLAKYIRSTYLITINAGHVNPAIAPLTWIVLPEEGCTATAMRLPGSPCSIAHIVSMRGTDGVLPIPLSQLSVTTLAVCRVALIYYMHAKAGHGERNGGACK